MSITKGYDRAIQKQCLLDLRMSEGVGSATLLDVAKPHHPMVINHSPAWGQTVAGQSYLSFTFSHPDYLSCASASAADLAFTVAGWTLAAWVNCTNAGNNYNTIMSKYTAAGGGWTWMLFGGPPMYQMLKVQNGGVGGASNMFSTSIIPGSTWALVSLTVYALSGTQSAEARPFCNGVDHYSSGGTGVITAPVVDFKVGWCGNEVKNPDSFRGSLTIPRVWSRPFAKAEHMELFNRERHLFGV